MAASKADLWAVMKVACWAVSKVDGPADWKADQKVASMDGGSVGSMALQRAVWKVYGLVAMKAVRSVVGGSLIGLLGRLRSWLERREYCGIRRRLTGRLFSRMSSGLVRGLHGWIH